MKGVDRSYKMIKFFSAVDEVAPIRSLILYNYFVIVMQIKLVVDRQCADRKVQVWCH